MLTTIAYNKTGEFLAVGDKGGRVIIFRYTNLKSSRYFDYKYFCEIQSHEPEFDHLKSVELNEKINSLEFLHTWKTNQTKLLSTNDRMIKLWSIEQRNKKQVSKKAYISGGVLKLPKYHTQEEGFEGFETTQFRNCHSYNINSLSVSPDCENFLSADALRINMWNFENPLEAY